MKRPFVKLIDKKRETIIFLLVGVLASILFYSFFIYLFEIERIVLQYLSFNQSASISKVARLKTNFIIGGISALVGNSVFLSLRFQKTQLNKKTKRLGSRVINDMSFVLPGFVHWFTRITFTVWVTILASQYESYIQKAFPYFFLAFYVMYLDSMKTINRFLGKRRFLVLLIHSSLLLFLAAILSIISLSNFGNIHKQLYKTQPVVTLPFVNCETCIISTDANSRNAIKIHHIDGITTFSTDGEERNKYEILKFIDHARNKIRHDNYYRPALWIEYDTPIADVLEFEKYLFLNRIPKVKYAFKVEVEGMYWEEIEYVQKQIPITKELAKEMSNYGFPPFPASIFKETNTSYSKLKRIDIHLANSTMNNISVDSLSKTLFLQMEKNTIFNFIFTEDLTFENYLKGLIAFQNSKEHFLNREMRISKPLNPSYFRAGLRKTKGSFNALSGLQILLVENHDFQEN